MIIVFVYILNFLIVNHLFRGYVYKQYKINR